jgi:hypothetical protein
MPLPRGEGRINNTNLVRLCQEDTGLEELSPQDLPGIERRIDLRSKWVPGDFSKLTVTLVAVFSPLWSLGGLCQPSRKLPIRQT